MGDYKMNLMQSYIEMKLGLAKRLSSTTIAINQFKVNEAELK
jgi:hypothetical protein